MCSAQSYNLYKDIQGRTNGEIFLGVVGPVRAGKSTFIHRFMELMVLPEIADEEVKRRMIDELPQSSGGRTIMTTEPKFIPMEPAEIQLEDYSTLKVRLIDCVGFLIPGAEGEYEGERLRLVHTPWSEEEIPFKDAATIGTQKVIRDHSTVGIVVITDGSFGEIAYENYEDAAKTCIQELKKEGKPFLVVLNTQHPYASETKQLATRLQEENHTFVLPINCKQMQREDVNKILQNLLYEFPVIDVEFELPRWTETLAVDHPVKHQLIQMAKERMLRIDCMKDAMQINGQSGAGSIGSNKECEKENKDCFEGREKLEEVTLSDGTVRISFTVPERYYYENLSALTGEEITGECQLMKMIAELSAQKKEYEKVKEALLSVEQKGYGVVMPELSDIEMENPVMIRHGNKFGVKMKALSPSIHMIRANIETEIAPIVGSEEQARDLISYIEESRRDGEGIWNTNIFGKSIGELMEDGIRGKVAMMDEECQEKLQDTMQKIVNDSGGGMVCIII